MITRRAFLAAAPLLALDKSTFAPAEQILQSAVSSGQLRAAVLRVERPSFVYEKSFGAAKVTTPFLIASISKPMTATAVMTLVEKGQLKLTDSASQYLPGLDPRIQVRHLLSHSSGLPDMLPDNTALRERHAPLSDFVKGALTTPLLFDPGTRVQYQSMGILLAATIAERLSNQPFPEFLERTVFAPLGMKSSVLGLGNRLKIKNTAQCQVEHGDPPRQTSWDWNSDYWRGLGAPWGGVHSTAADISKFVRYFLNPEGRPLSPAAAQLMLTDQNPGLNQPWGLGWALTPRTFGHSGSTGTLCWADAPSRTSFVLVTTLPARVSEKPIIEPISQLVQKAL